MNNEFKFLNTKERWPRGLRRRFAKPLYGCKAVPGVRIPPSPPFYKMHSSHKLYIYKKSLYSIRSLLMSNQGRSYNNVAEGFANMRNSFNTEQKYLDAL